MKKSILTLILAFAVTCSFAQDTETYKASLKKMMRVTGSEGAYKGIVEQMMSMSKKQQPNVPDGFWEEITAEMNKNTFDQVIDRMLPVYKKHLTEADLLGLIAFYDTPVGKKFAEKSPLIAVESMSASQEWARELSEKIMERIKAKGY